MTPKKRLEAFVQGWLPKESNLHVCQGKVSHKRWRPSRRLVLPLIIGAFMGGLLGAVGPFLDWTSWLGPYLWPILIGLITIWIVSAALLARMKQKEEQQKSAKELKT